jgi:hypothetical protein
VVATSSHHALVKMSDMVAVRYEKEGLDRDVRVGEKVTIQHGNEKSQVYEQGKEPARENARTWAGTWAGKQGRKTWRSTRLAGNPFIQATQPCPSCWPISTARGSGTAVPVPYPWH